MHDFLRASQYVDSTHPLVVVQARELAAHVETQVDIAEQCFEFVRDNIKHSGDYQLDPVTCKASEVLAHGTGYCYAKSHLLAALLRANEIPAGLCYQRLTIANDKPPFCLHGLNAVYLKGFGWYRIDARGNTQGIDAQFMPPQEKLAFSVNLDGEADLPGILAEPLPEVVGVLIRSTTFQDVADNLPDVEYKKLAK